MILFGTLPAASEDCTGFERAPSLWNKCSRHPASTMYCTWIPEMYSPWRDTSKEHGCEFQWLSVIIPRFKFFQLRDCKCNATVLPGYNDSCQTVIFQSCTIPTICPFVIGADAVQPKNEVRDLGLVL